jgi:hypothetical protein
VSVTAADDRKVWRKGLNIVQSLTDEHREMRVFRIGRTKMLLRMKVLVESVDSKGKTFQATGQTTGMSPEEVQAIATNLEAGAVTRFYRGGQPHGRVVAARGTGDGLWLKIRIRTKDAEIWKLVETGAVNTVEVQPLPQGVDVFLKSVAATYPAPVV